MKKVVAFILAFTLIFSSAAIFAYAEHAHEPGVYVDEMKTENYHTFYCQTCGETVSQEHNFNENNECDCGYVAHEHKPGFYVVIHQEGHAYICQICNATIIESHKMNENSKCDCGYTNHVHKPDVYGITPTAHLYYCKECYSQVTERHTINEKGRCVCGYAASGIANPIVVMFQPFTMMFSVSRFLMSAFIIGMKNGWNQGLEIGLGRK